MCTATVSLFAHNQEGKEGEGDAASPSWGGGIMTGWDRGLSRVFAWTIHHQQRLIALLC